MHWAQLGVIRWSRVLHLPWYRAFSSPFPLYTWCHEVVALLKKKKTKQKKRKTKTKVLLYLPWDHSNIFLRCMSISGTLTGFCMEHYFRYYISTLCTLRKVKHSSHFHLSFIQKDLLLYYIIPSPKAITSATPYLVVYRKPVGRFSE